MFNAEKVKNDIATEIFTADCTDELPKLSPDIIIERLFSRIPEEDADFSNWNTSWWKLQDELLEKMHEEEAYQGKDFNYLNGSALNKL